MKFRGCCGMMLLAGAFFASQPRQADADVFQLHNGRELRGVWANRDEVPRERYVIETTSGAKLILPREQVRKVVEERPEQIEYDRVRHTYPHTAEAQWELAEWCRENHLFLERKSHLEQVVAINPDHAPARTALGYQRVDEGWMTQEQIMADRGYVRYDGRWRTPQEIQLIEEARRSELRQKRWFREIARLRDDLDDAEEWQVAVQKIRQIDDPNAVPAIENQLEEEENEKVKVLLLDALGNIGPAARMLLCKTAIQDENQEVRLSALDQLKKEKHPDTVQTFVKALRSKENHVINRAALGLALMDDPSAVGPLIDVLVTEHKFKVTSGSQGISTTFGTGSGPGSVGGLPAWGSGGSGMSMGQSTKVYTQVLRNEPVRDALVVLTGGKNFGYDMAAWKKWFAQEKKPASQGVRRD